MDDAEDLCPTCGQTRDWHERNKPRHPWGGAGQLNQKEKKEARPQVFASQGGDVALRLALVRAGVITHEQLITAEETLRAAREAGRPVLVDTTPARSGVPDEVDRLPEDLGSGDRGGA